MRFLLLAATIACSGSKDDTPDDTPPVEDTDTLGGGGGGGNGGATISLTEFCEQAADAYADHLFACFNSSGYQRGTPEGDNFRARMTEACLAVEPGVAEGRVRFNGVAGRQCLAAAVADEGCRWDLSGFQHAPCRDVFTPLIPHGGACSQSEALWFLIGGSCDDGWCDESEGCPGVCTPWASSGDDCTITPCDPNTAWCDISSNRCADRAEVGESCAVNQCVPDARCVDGECVGVAKPGDTCGDDLVCSVGLMQCVDGVCDIRAAAGEPCTGPFTCDPSLVCRDDDGDAEKSCVAPGEVGARCEVDADCIRDAWCDQETGTCAARANLDDFCDESPCSLDAWCQWPDKGSPTCQPPRQEGEECWQWYGPALDPQACANGMLCMDTGTCHPNGGQGDPCAVARNSCLQDLFCSRETVTCAPLGEAGDACNPVAEKSCAEGLACTCTGTAEQCAEGVSVWHQPWHTCEAVKGEGEVCWSWQECASFACDTCADGDCDGAGLCVASFEECLL